MVTNTNMFQQDAARQVYPIGRVRQLESSFELAIDEPFRAGLKELAQFSHIFVIWWAGEHDNPQDRSTLVTDLPYAAGLEAGVFACRSPYRPNPIAFSVCPVFDMDEDKGTISIFWIDAFDGTAILDIKPYIPMSDRPREVEVASWFKDWPAWMEDAADFDFAAHGLADD